MKRRQFAALGLAGLAFIRPAQRPKTFQTGR